MPSTLDPQGYKNALQSVIRKVYSFKINKLIGRTTRLNASLLVKQTACILSIPCTMRTTISSSSFLYSLVCLHSAPKTAYLFYRLHVCIYVLFFFFFFLGMNISWPGNLGFASRLFSRPSLSKESPLSCRQSSLYIHTHRVCVCVYLTKINLVAPGSC